MLKDKEEPMLEKVLKSVEKLDKKISRLEKEAAGETRELVNNAIESGEDLKQIERTMKPGNITEQRLTD